MRRPEAGSGAWTAYAVAMLLVLQPALLSFAGGANAAPVVRDQFGNVLCMPSAGGRFDPSHERHGTDASCCTLGCPMLGGPTPPETGAARLAPPRYAEPIRFALRAARLRAADTAAPRNARAPPAPIPL